MLSLHPRRRAFTLLELIVVIVVLGILAALAVPTFARVIERSKDSSSEQTLASLHREAAALAAFDASAVDVDDVTRAVSDLSPSASATTSPSTGPSVVSYHLVDGTVGLATLDGSRCSYLVAVPTSPVKRWTLSAAGSSCTGAEAVGAGGANLVSDPSFETSSDVTTYVGAATPGSFSYSTAQKRSGNRSLLYTCAPNPGNDCYVGVMGFMMSPSTTYTWTAWVYYPSASSTVTVDLYRMYLQERAGGWRATANAGTGLTSVPANTWIQVGGTGRTPSVWDTTRSSWAVFRTARPDDGSTSYATAGGYQVFVDDIKVTKVG